MKFIKPMLIIVILLCFCLLCSTTHVIDQSGNGDFISIQEGINSSVNGDTIIVYPGTYFENLSIENKTITLGSKFITTGNEEFISQTIINGNQNGSCIIVRDCNAEDLSINGFTITSGSGSQLSESLLFKYGGGLLLRDSKITIANCEIVENKADFAGGINCKNSEVNFSSTSIRYNKSRFSGGGLLINDGSIVSFDEENLCSIYMNYSSLGADIFKIESPAVSIFLDTLTVLNSDTHFVYASDQYAQPQNDIELSIQSAFLEPVDADLYVAPDGDDTNSGLTAEEPLQTISYATTLIQPDSLYNNSIFVADGTYSQSLNNQWFPLGMRSYTNLIGESMQSTILDGEYISSFIIDRSSGLNYSVKNFSFVNGYGMITDGSGLPFSILCEDASLRNRWVNLESISIFNNDVEGRLIGLWLIDTFVKDVHIFDNDVRSNAIQFTISSNDPMHSTTVKMENCSVKNCDTDGLGFHMGIQEVLSSVVLKNIEITDNYNTDTFFWDNNSAMRISSERKVDIINCTIGDNRTQSNQGGAIGILGNNNILNIYNSIL